MPVYDAESMTITAQRVEQIAEDFRSSMDKLKGIQGDSPFGDVEDPDDPDRVAGTVGAFTDGMRSEFSAAASRVNAAGMALRNALGAMTEADAVAADNLTARDL
ncbi:hypothetical protein ACWGRK_03635 [Saccharomonospora azurea]|uniref:PE domain-containing protein n=1 Tax=Saccharomonospora azurea NA-128 TaxID=882081 RepID=H8G8Y8_9PSEU|nr:hypothetical protein [Saccharomonospora azurea]EHK89066.1 hypothetical protein SZMC14600_01829 [Saccharomonospora azurea SZMC 14600]EHY89504.1 hypothetical protein SacazDRAFT_02610 [Saccharomonospora azurea NA-128]